MGLTFQNTVTPGRVVDGNLVSDRDQEPDVPIFGNVQNSGSGNVTIVWSEVTADSQGNPITLLNYELRYREVGTIEYTLILVPPAFVGHSLTESAGNYEGFVQAVSTGGYISTPATFTFNVL